jgi:pilus assembly protein CpaE
MAIVSPFASGSRRSLWPCKTGFVVGTAELAAGLARAIADAGGKATFELGVDASSFEVAGAVDRERPEVLFVELARMPAGWLAEVRRGEELPLVVAVHATADPAEMIAALRAGASEFLSLPVAAGIGEVMDRIGALLEARRTASAVKGRIVGILSAKGGCGATSIACYLGAALSKRNPAMRVLVADLDYQAPAGHQVLRLEPGSHAGHAFDSVRHLNSNSWVDFVSATSSLDPPVDLLASPAYAAGGRDAAPAIPEQWRVESLFRFASKQYGWILADLGRHLNPANWTFLQSADELFIVTVPDVLALYQTRSILQTLSSRGFDKSRIRMILNRNPASPQDFWVESIEQMFEMAVYAIVPNDFVSLEKVRRDRFEFPSDTSFGRALLKLAARLDAPQKQAA